MKLSTVFRYPITYVWSMAALLGAFLAKSVVANALGGADGMNAMQLFLFAWFYALFTLLIWLTSNTRGLTLTSRVRLAAGSPMRDSDDGYEAFWVVLVTLGVLGGVPYVLLIALFGMLLDIPAWQAVVLLIATLAGVFLRRSLPLQHKPEKS